MSSGLKYQHLSPPSPEIDYIPIRVELREKTTRALLEVHHMSRTLTVGVCLTNTVEIHRKLMICRFQSK